MVMPVATWQSLTWVIMVQRTLLAGRRFGFFPAVSAGWVVSEEPFFPKNDWLVYMKLRATYGEVR